MGAQAEISKRFVLQCSSWLHFSVLVCRKPAVADGRGVACENCKTTHNYNVHAFLAVFLGIPCAHAHCNHKPQYYNLGTMTDTRRDSLKRRGSLPKPLAVGALL